MTDLSLGEFRSLAAKALRGAGYSWGLAEDGAFAAKRLAEFGMPSGEMLARLLDQVDGVGPADLVSTASGPVPRGGLCSIRLGCMLADSGGCERIEPGPTIEPHFLAPPLLVSLGDETTSGYRVSWPGGSFQLGDGRFEAHGELPTIAVDILIERCAVPERTVEQERRVVVPPAVVERLNQFAHRLYAPATETSRESGAGAGLVDSD